MTEELHPTADPAAFDVEGWLQDAHLPEESATVYKRPDVVAELTDLKRRIELEERAAGGERAAAEQEVTPLEAEYATLLDAFSKSALTVYVQALTDDKLRSLRAEVDAATKDLTLVEQNAEFGYALLAAAIVAVKPAGGHRTPATFTTAKVKALVDSVGQTQVGLVLAARQQAQNALPSVDADFLHKRSGSEPGQE
ncbi:hypothetical protein [Arthrobacter sp. B3I4]|uniref:hypothetical protein n=1 Tax=Arthrobacter sp. B3I4 TaxID=3042267 RepID=UPI0027809C74|nr:hypothetical protein [Arthrobacter sp. B3I4]MDQ0756071.1 hypothetical protein [Arthrobacter sp. B3I4]